MKKAQKNQIKNYLLIVIATSLACILCISSIVGGIRFWGENKKSDVINYQNIKIKKPSVHEMFLTVNVNSRPQAALEKVKGIVVHYTANPGTSAKANRDYFESRKKCEDKVENKVSSHYIIGLQGEIIQCIPETEIAYASNSRNADTIAIECCHPDTSGKFTEKTYQSLIEMLSYLCVKYQLTGDQIIRHYDVTKKLCPKYYVKHPKAWKKIKKDVSEYCKKHTEE